MNSSAWYLIIHILSAPGFDYDVRVPFDDHGACLSAVLHTIITLSKGSGGSGAFASVNSPHCEEGK